MDTAVQFLGFTVMTLSLPKLVMAVGGMLGLVPLAPLWTDSGPSGGERS